MKKNTFFGLLFFSFFVFSLSAQEVLSSLETNPTIKQYLNKQPIIQKKAVVASPTLTLPFFDDFKYEGPYPDAKKWSDQYVFINTGFQKIPANRGVATFDALNEYGYVYDHATFTAFEADKLTSHKIRLDSLFGAIQRPLTIGDSLYLSFYFQPQGIGNKPEKDDIIELEFFVRDADTIFTIDSIYHEADTLWITDSTWMQIDSAYWEIDTTFVYYEEQWKTMWSSNGINIDSFYLQNNTWMQHVMIPIIDPSDLRPDFRFRFKNYASIGNDILPSWQSNMDQWNIDYVYLNYNRFWFDTTYRDISFINPGVSLLKNYTSMPYSQFKNDAFNAMKANFEYVYSNLDNNAQNVNYSYRIFNSNGSVVNADYSTIEWSDFVLPFIENGVYTKNSNVVLIYPIAPLLDSNQFIVKQWIRGDDAAVSDSISFVQSFSNYYAYDDGTPEAGYGITPAESKMALHFSLNHKDTLRAIDIFFNSTKERNNPNYLESFNFVIWNDNHGKPDNILYEQQMFISSEKTGHFERFYLDEPIQIAAGGIFMGTIQETDANLNIGFDGSNPQQNQLFYKTPADNWKNSEFEGSLLFRPVFGKAIHDYPDTTTAAPKSLTVAPNPNANSSRTFQILLNYSFQANEHDLKVEVFNMLGQRVYAAPFTASVTLGNVSSGIYIVRVSNYTTGYVESTKLIIQ